MSYDEVAAQVVAVSQSPQHRFTKQVQPSIRLVAGYGVKGDAHAGVTVRHRSRVRKDPTAPNLRQVHLIAAELLDELNTRGFDVSPGDLGENLTTRHLDILGLPRTSRLHVGHTVVIEVTGLRNPCVQLDRFRPGLMHAVLERDSDNRLVRKAGIMAVVIAGGEVHPGDAITVERPSGVPHEPLQSV